MRELRKGERDVEYFRCFDLSFQIKDIAGEKMIFQRISELDFSVTVNNLFLFHSYSNKNHIYILIYFKVNATNVDFK